VPGPSGQSGTLGGLAVVAGVLNLRGPGARTARCWSYRIRDRSQSALDFMVGTVFQQRLRVLGLTQLDEPPPQLPVHRLGPEDRPARRRPATGVEHERIGLAAPHAPVGADISCCVPGASERHYAVEVLATSEAIERPPRRSMSPAPSSRSSASEIESFRSPPWR
jgi:hypothetical protein